MKLEAKFRREDVPPARAWQKGLTYIYIDISVDGVYEGAVSPKLFISGWTRDIGHLDPNVHSFEDYRAAIAAGE